MYIYKFTITYVNGHQRNEWISHEPGESLASMKDRADVFMDELEADRTIASARMIRRTVPGI